MKARYALTDKITGDTLTFFQSPAAASDYALTQLMKERIDGRHDHTVFDYALDVIAENKGEE